MASIWCAGYYFFRHCFTQFNCSQIIPLVLYIPPVLTSSYGDAGGWYGDRFVIFFVTIPRCWIKGNDRWGNIWRVVQFYGIIWVVIISCLLVHVKLIRRLGKLKSGPSLQKTVVNSLYYFPLILVMSWTIQGVLRVKEIIGAAVVAYGIL